MLWKNIKTKHYTSAVLNIYKNVLLILSVYVQTFFLQTFFFSAIKNIYITN